MYEEGIAAFAECAGGAVDPMADSCRRESGLKKLRAAALVDHDNFEYWDAVACVRERYFGGIGESFYRAQAERTVKDDDQILEDICMNRAPARLALYLSERALIRVIGDECHPNTVVQAARALRNNGSLYPNLESLFDTILSKPSPGVPALAHAADTVGEHAPKFSDPAGSLRELLVNLETETRVLSSIATSALKIDDYELLEEIFDHSAIDGRVLRDIARNAGRSRDVEVVLSATLSHAKVRGSAISAALETANSNADRIDDLQGLLLRAASSLASGIFSLSRAAFVTAVHIHRLPDPEAVIDAILDNPKTEETDIAWAVAMGMDHDPERLPRLFDRVFVRSRSPGNVVDAATRTIARHAEKLVNSRLLLRQLYLIRQRVNR